MTIYQEKYGFVYIWFDRKYTRYYIGCHWGTEDDGYICSSSWMKQAYKHRSADFKRRILNTNISSKEDMYLLEKKWLSLIKSSEISPNTQTPRYYNLNITGFIPWHAKEDIKTVGEKIAIANTGKKRPCTPERAQAVSEGKTKAFAKRQEELGYKFTESHVKNMAESKRAKNRKHTDEWKAENGKRVKKQWETGVRKRRKETTKKLTKEEQAKISSDTLKTNWTDPDWRANQKHRLSEGAKSRPPRSEESKQKARLAQIGKPKNQKQYLIIFADGTDVIVNGLHNYAKYSNIPMGTLSGIANGRFPAVKNYNIVEIIRL